jgi:hypothetical protein
MAPACAPDLKLGKNGASFTTPSDRGVSRCDNERSRQRCGCDNPSCELPVGRCFLCKEPVGNNRTYAVCADCDEQHHVRDVWQAAYAQAQATEEHSPSDRGCCCCGWLWMNEEDDGSFNIERCDECDTLLDDMDAANAMVLLARITNVEFP